MNSLRRLCFAKTFGRVEDKMMDYSNNSVDFYYDPKKIRYIIQGLTQKGLEYKQKFDPWQEIMQRELKYVDYEDKKK